MASRRVSNLSHEPKTITSLLRSFCSRRWSIVAGVEVGYLRGTHGKAFCGDMNLALVYFIFVVLYQFVLYISWHANRLFFYFINEGNLLLHASHHGT